MVAKTSRLKVISTPAQCPIVGVALTINPPQLSNSHVGIIYRDSAKRPSLLHLAFHHKLITEQFDPRNYICADPELGEEDAHSLAAYCRLLADGNSTDKIKFAIHYNPTAKFSVSDRGRVFLEFEGKGLNCSTFVLALFYTAGPTLALVDFKTWKARKEDIPWQRQLLRLLRKENVAPSYWKKVAKDIGCKRVRPEEVAGACLEEKLPATFQQCVANGVTALAAVTSLTGRTSRW